jgi:hypothetical protein
VIGRLSRYLRRPSWGEGFRAGVDLGYESGLAAGRFAGEQKLDKAFAEGVSFGIEQGRRERRGSGERMRRAYNRGLGRAGAEVAGSLDEIADSLPELLERMEPEEVVVWLRLYAGAVRAAADQHRARASRRDSPALRARSGV